MLSAWNGEITIAIVRCNAFLDNAGRYGNNSKKPVIQRRMYQQLYLDIQDQHRDLVICPGMAIRFARTLLPSLANWSYYHNFLHVASLFDIMGFTA